MRFVFDQLSPARRAARLQIFIFHRVLSQPDPLWPDEVDAHRFDRTCAWLRAWFNVLPLVDAVRLLERGELPARAAAITFDDGYADNQSIALPLLQRHGLPATFFVATGFLDGGLMWNDRLTEAVRSTTQDSLDAGDLGLAGVARLPLDSVLSRRATLRALIGAAKYLEPSARTVAVQQVVRRLGAEPPGDLMMRSQQVQQLHRAGMTIGAHTVNHPILARVPEAVAAEEIRAGRQTLRELIGAEIELFAYPNGKPGQDYLPRDVQTVRQQGFVAAVSTAWGAAGAGSPLHELPRFTPWDRGRWRFGLRLARNLWDTRERRAPNPLSPAA